MPVSENRDTKSSVTSEPLEVTIQHVVVDNSGGNRQQQEHVNSNITYQHYYEGVVHKKYRYWRYYFISIVTILLGFICVSNTVWISLLSHHHQEDRDNYHMHLLQNDSPLRQRQPQQQQQRGKRRRLLGTDLEAYASNNINNNHDQTDDGGSHDSNSHATTNSTAMNTSSFTNTNDTIIVLQDSLWNSTNSSIAGTSVNSTNNNISQSLFYDAHNNMSYIQALERCQGDECSPSPTTSPRLAVTDTWMTRRPTLPPTPEPTFPVTPEPTEWVMTRRPTIAPTHKETFPPTSFPTSLPTAAPTIFPTSQPSPFPTLRPTPTKRPTAFPTLPPTLFPTPQPTNAPTPELLPLIRNEPENGAPQVQQTNLGICEGDCDSDSDCADGLHCLYRDSGDPIPGCYWPSFDTTDGVDYCVDTNRLGWFRLRLYWQDGYRWQEDRDEQFWCMVHSMGTEWSWCAEGTGEGPCEDDGIYIEECSSREMRQFFRFRDLSNPNFEFMIESAVNSEYCLRGGRLRYERCDPNNPDQRFIATDNDARISNRSFRFEISQIGKDGRCLSQHHHPREREEIRLLDCATQRSYDTSYWQIYYND